MRKKNVAKVIVQSKIGFAESRSLSISSDPVIWHLNMRFVWEKKKFFDEKGSSKNVEKVFCRLMNFDWLLRFRRQTHPKREKGDLGTYHALREKLWHVSKIRFILRGDRQRTKNLKKLLNHITQLRRSHLTLLEQKRAKKSKNLSFVFKLWR